jgi:ADP-heptose:LPS heptosyltransferase
MFYTKMNKEVFLDLSEAKGLGDTLCSTPVIRKISESYGSKINLISNHPALFKRNPLINKNYSAGNINIDHIKSNYIYHSSFYNVGKKNEFGIEYKTNIIDIRQYHAIMLGFNLMENEMELDYVPDPYIPIDFLPEKYVLIHPVQTWPSRTWDAQSWILLTKKLNDIGIAVVSVGKDSSETGFFNVSKPVFNFTIPLGLNLMNKTDISQTWHLIDKSICIVTMDSGLLHVAGTTDSEIIQLGSSINNKLRAPFRKGSQDYKYTYVSGGCNIFCASNMKYGVKEWGNIQGVPPLIGCLEHKPTFECHPTVEKVFNKIQELISNG